MNFNISILQGVILYAVENKSRFFLKCDKKDCTSLANLHKRHKKIAILNGVVGGKQKL